jgi:adenine phosphoribosyltransferase
MTIKSKIRTVPHYPKQGIQFRDITTLLKDPVGFRATVDELVDRYKDAKIDRIAGIESRGFILGAPLAYALNKGFIPIRKKASCPPKPLVTITNSNMAPTASRYTPTRSPKVKRYCWWTT